MRLLNAESLQGGAQAARRLAPAREVVFRQWAVALTSGAPVAAPMQPRHRHQASQLAGAALIGCAGRQCRQGGNCEWPACAGKGRG